MTIFVFFLGALLGFFWLLLLQTLFWNLPKSDSRSHYQKVNKVSDNHWFLLLPTRWLSSPLYWVFACICYGGLCGVAFHASESFLAFVWLTSAFLLSLTDLIDYSVYPQLLYPAHLLLALAQLWRIVIFKDLIAFIDCFRNQLAVFFRDGHSYL